MRRIFILESFLALSLAIILGACLGNSGGGGGGGGGAEPVPGEALTIWKYDETESSTDDAAMLSYLLKTNIDLQIKKIEIVGNNIKNSQKSSCKEGDNLGRSK